MSAISVLALIGANLIPLGGVLFLGWRLFPIMLLYSLENVVIGFYNVLRMQKARCDLEELRKTSEGVNSKKGLIRFFCLHYGMFSFGHLLFVFVIFGVVASNPNGEMVDVGGTSVHPGFLELPKYNWSGIFLALGAIFVSHGVSYVRNFIGAGEFRQVTSNQLMMRPYGRIAVMHVMVILGAIPAVKWGSPVAAMVLFVLLKIVADAIAHLRERRKFRTMSHGL
jgi:hypothetical protein